MNKLNQLSKLRLAFISVVVALLLTLSLLYVFIPSSVISRAGGYLGYDQGIKFQFESNTEIEDFKIGNVSLDYQTTGQLGLAQNLSAQVLDYQVNYDSIIYSKDVYQLSNSDLQEFFMIDPLGYENVNVNQAELDKIGSDPRFAELRYVLGFRELLDAKLLAKFAAHLDFDQKSSSWDNYRFHNYLTGEDAIAFMEEVFGPESEVGFQILSIDLTMDISPLTSKVQKVNFQTESILIDQIFKTNSTYTNVVGNDQQVSLIENQLPLTSAMNYIDASVGDFKSPVSMTVFTTAGEKTISKFMNKVFPQLFTEKIANSAVYMPIRPVDKSSIKNRREKAYAMYCAMEQGFFTEAFVAVHTSGSKKLDPEKLVARISPELDLDTFLGCLQDGKYKPLYKQLKRLAPMNKISNTPVFAFANPTNNKTKKINKVVNYKKYQQTINQLSK